MTSLEILKMIEVVRSTEGYPEINRSIVMLADEIKKNFRYSFGIEMEWKNEPTH